MADGVLMGSTFGKIVGKTPSHDIVGQLLVPFLSGRPRKMLEVNIRWVYQHLPIVLEPKLHDSMI